VVGFSEFNSGDEVRPEVDENYHFCTEGTWWVPEKSGVSPFGKMTWQFFGISPLEISG
jgi:hypothetical protein